MLLYSFDSKNWYQKPFNSSLTDVFQLGPRSNNLQKFSFDTIKKVHGFKHYIFYQCCFARDPFLAKFSRWLFLL